MKVSDRSLLRWLCGAASPELAARVEAALPQSEELQARVAWLQQGLADLSGRSRPRWAPPVSRWDSGALAVFGEDEAIEVFLPEGPASTRVVLIGSEGTVVYPTNPEEMLSLGDLELREGRRVLVLSHSAGAVALALVPADGPGPEWDSPDVWAGVELAIRAGVAELRSL